MKHHSPKTSDFIIRVGGFLCVTCGLILLAKNLYPGSEVRAAMISCCLGIIFLTYEYYRDSKKLNKVAGVRKNRERKK